MHINSPYMANATLHDIHSHGRCISRPARVQYELIRALPFPPRHGQSPFVPSHCLLGPGDRCPCRVEDKVLHGAPRLFPPPLIRLWAPRQDGRQPASRTLHASYVLNNSTGACKVVPTTKWRHRHLIEYFSARCIRINSVR